MISQDLIRNSLAAPIDWSVFEDLVYDILLQDDFPALRKLGGRGDGGADAIEEAFYVDERQPQVVVQVTSERAQEGKCSSTIRRLRQSGQDFKRLVMVYRDPVASGVRGKILDAASAEGVIAEVRDETYLVGQLGRTETGIYVRYFQDTRTQVERLLSATDPLDMVTDRQLRAVLASLGAYVASPRARIARSTLFDRTVLAALIACGADTSVDALLPGVRKLLPEEQIDSTRLRASLGRLERESLCELKNGTVSPTEAALETMATILTGISAAYDRMFRQLILDVCQSHKLDDAAKGRLERNLKRALALLVRFVGPTIDFSEAAKAELCVDAPAFRTVLGEGMRPEVARTALASLSGFICDDANKGILATMARSYQALAIRDLDPVGKRWQQTTLGRSRLLLDTDVVIVLMIEELPEHAALLEALRAMHDAGATLVVPRPVLDEAIGHAERAGSTFAVFRDRLTNMVPMSVDRVVHNQLARGYYYHRKAGGHLGFRAYQRKYFDQTDSLAYARNLLGRRIDFELGAVPQIADEDASDFQEIADAMLADKEPARLKAQYRDEDAMRSRVDIDVRLAFQASRIPVSSGGSPAEAYVVSCDPAFSLMQHHPAWGARPRVHLHTRAVAALAEMTTGIVLDDSQVVKLMFDPVLSAAADSMAPELDALARAGVALQDVDLPRLEYDLCHSLEGLAEDYDALSGDPDTPKEQMLGAALALVEKMLGLGYVLAPDTQALYESYEEAAAEAKKAKRAQQDAEEQAARATAFAKRLIEGAAGLTPRRRRRVNRVLREMGIFDRTADDLDFLANDEDDCAEA